MVHLLFVTTAHFEDFCSVLVFKVIGVRSNRARTLRSQTFQLLGCFRLLERKRFLETSKVQVGLKHRGVRIDFHIFPPTYIARTPLTSKLTFSLRCFNKGTSNKNINLDSVYIELQHTSTIYCSSIKQCLPRSSWGPREGINEPPKVPSTLRHGLWELYQGCES